MEALYNHYATQDDQGDVIQGTDRCPVLPQHIKCDVHDVASAFKRFLGGLPNGILGCMWLYDALISIHGLLDSDLRAPKTKQSRVRARLIALAIASIPSRSERDFICAVMGLMSMIGSAAEIVHTDEDDLRALPMSELMNYKALSIIVGPLLLGEMLDSYGIKSPSQISNDGHFHTPGCSPPKSFRRSHKKFGTRNERASIEFHAEKIRLANAVTEMLITHWQDVVRQMKDLGALKSVRDCQLRMKSDRNLRHSISQSYVLPKPRIWDGSNRASYLDQCFDTQHRDKSPSSSTHGKFFDKLLEHRF